MWTSSLRLRGGVLGTGACLAALACAANGWAAGGTPMPAPDDPPPAYQASTVKTSASTTAPTAPRAKRVAESAPSGADARRPALRSVDHDVEGSHREAGRGSRARSLSGRGVGIVHPECPDTPRASAGGTARATTPAPRSTFTPPRSRAEAERRSRSRNRSRRPRSPRRSGRDPSRRPAPGRRAARSAGRSARPPLARRRRHGGRAARRRGAPPRGGGRRQPPARRRSAYGDEARMRAVADRVLCSWRWRPRCGRAAGRGACARSADRELQRWRVRRVVQVGRHRVAGRTTGAAPRARAAAERRRSGTTRSGATFTCTVNYGGSFVGSSVTVRKDSSPPGVSASASRGPDTNGWYTSPVSFSFTGDDGASGVASCTSGTYSGPDGGDITVSGSCTDNAGNTGSTSVKIKYDGTAPTVAGTPARKPDAERVVQPSGRRRVHGHRRRVGRHRVLTDGDVQGPGRQPRQARRPVPGRRRPPERADDGRVALRRHASRPPERQVGQQRRVDLARAGRPARTSCRRRSSVLPA